MKLVTNQQVEAKKQYFLASYFLRFDLNETGTEEKEIT